MQTCIFLTFFCASFLFSFTGTVDPDNEQRIEILDARGMNIGHILPDPIMQYTQTDIDPGQPPEGDYLGWAAFTKDGSRVLLTNRFTDNITVFDWQTMAVVTNIDVGDYPAGIAVSDSYAVVPCVFSDAIYIINLNTYGVDTILTVPAGQQPMAVKLSPDGSRAYIACDISNTCEVFDLQTMSHVLTINNFPFGLMTISWNSENGRNAFTTTNYEITDDDAYVIVSGYCDTLFYINTATGNRDYQLLIADCPTVGLSGDGSKTITLSNTNPATIYQIDNTTHAVTGTVTTTGYSLSFYGLSVNMDGQKAFISTSNNTSAIVRFATNDFVTFTSTYSAFWIGTSPDHSKAISGQYRFSIIDFATETMLGQHQGNSQYAGAVSPVGSRATGYDEHRHEGIYFYDYTTNTPVFRGTTNSGQDPEADGPRRVAITPDGSKAVVANVLSDNAAIIDLSSLAVEAILPIGDRAQDVAITSNSRWAVVCGMNSNSVKVIDLLSNSVAADVPTGTGASVVTIAPDDSFAYVGNMIVNTVSKVRLNGAASTEVAEISCGEIGVVWAAYGVSSDVRISPDDDYVLVAVSFEDAVRVIDVNTNSVVAILPVGDFPIQIDFDSTGDYATVTNGFSDNFSIIYVDGAASGVVGTFSTSDYPLRLDYNSANYEMGIGNFSAKTVANVNPQTGALISTDYYTTYGSLIQVIFDELGDPIVLTGAMTGASGHIHRGADHIVLPAAPSFFDYCPAVQKAAVAMPGPDYLTVIDWSGTFVKEITTIPVNPCDLLITASPNPFRNIVNIKFQSAKNPPRKLAYGGPKPNPPYGVADQTNSKFQTPNLKFQGMLKIYDATGRIVRSFSLPPSNFSLPTSIVWDGTDEQGKTVNSGIYFVELNYGSFSQTEKIVYTR